MLVHESFCVRGGGSYRGVGDGHRVPEPQLAVPTPRQRHLHTTTLHSVLYMYNRRLRRRLVKEATSIIWDHSLNTRGHLCRGRWQSGTYLLQAQVEPARPEANGKLPTLLLLPELGIPGDVNMVVYGPDQ